MLLRERGVRGQLHEYVGYQQPAVHGEREQDGLGRRSSGRDRRVYLRGAQLQQRGVLQEQPLLQRRPLRRGKIRIVVSWKIGNWFRSTNLFDTTNLSIRTARCQCPAGYNGPRCQQTARSFRGNGWAWYPALEMCDNSHLSFEFITKKPDGLLLYNGPIVPPEADEIMVSGK